MVYIMGGSGVGPGATLAPSDLRKDTPCSKRVTPVGGFSSSFYYTDFDKDRIIPSRSKIR